MNCHYCNGVDTVEEETTRFCACDIPQPFVVENVPAFVCYLCGDKSFLGGAIKAMDKIKRGEARANGSRYIRVFDFRQLAEDSEPVPNGGLRSTFVNPNSIETTAIINQETPVRLHGAVQHMRLRMFQKAQDKVYINVKMEELWKLNLLHTQVQQVSKYDYLRAWQKMG